LKSRSGERSRLGIYAILVEEGHMRNVTGRRVLYGMAALVTFGFSAEWVSAQEEAPLPASPGPPPDVQEREKLGKPPAPPGRSPEVDELLQKVHLSRADIEQRKADKTQRALPAATDEPPDAKDSRRAEKPPEPPARSPDLTELLDKIRKQPGGADRLERARRAGARIPSGGAGGTAVNFNTERSSGPRVEWPSFEFLPAEAQGSVLKATRAAAYQNVPGLGTLSVSDFTPYSSNSSSTWGGYWRTTYTGAFGSVDVKPYLMASVNVTNPGWYIINFVATRGKASLRKYDPGYPTLAQWDNSTSANPYESYPAVLNLAAGYHWFYWLPEPGFYEWVSEVSVTKL
jgi:hypothetical protein